MARNKGDRTTTRTQQPEGRTRIWQAMRFMKRFDLAQLQQTTEQSESNCRQFVKRLLACGYVRQTARADGQPGQGNEYRLVRDTGPKAPGICNDGSVLDYNTGAIYDPADYKAPDTGRQKAWDLMRKGKPFTTEDLAQVMSQSGARVYVNALYKAGYLSRDGGGGHGKGAERFWRYRLINDTGELAPTVARKGGVIDRNLTAAEGGSATDEQQPERN